MLAIAVASSIAGVTGSSDAGAKGKYDNNVRVEGRGWNRTHEVHACVLGAPPDLEQEGRLHGHVHSWTANGIHTRADPGFPDSSGALLVTLRAQG